MVLPDAKIENLWARKKPLWKEAFFVKTKLNGHKTY
jgi:hypothetical protein